MSVSGTPLLVMSGSRDAPDRKKKKKAHHTETVPILQTTCTYTYPYPLRLHPASISMLAVSPISHCNSTQQRNKVLWDAARRDTAQSGGRNGEEQRRRMRWRAAEAELT